ncbi:MAG: type III-B CRISPR module-associated Cmr3 family protein [Cyanobacteria bacterium P01_F01_bin.143]
MTQNNIQNQFQYLIAIKPLGLLYGSFGSFLSPENLVGRSSQKFPPDATTLSGVYAAHYGEGSEELKNLQLAGSFWAKEDDLQNWYFPTPFNCLVKRDRIQHLLVWHEEEEKWRPPTGSKIPEDEKFNQNSWISLDTWQELSQFKGKLPELKVITKDPWETLPQLHPQLRKGERRAVFDQETQRGKLFLENSIQLEPDVNLIYLSSIELPNGWYRFGGEGHFVEISSHKLKSETLNLLNASLGRSFALISSGVWGTNRFSYREPMVLNSDSHSEPEKVWDVQACMTKRPKVFRYRLGKKKKTDETDTKSHSPRLLSRGRYAVPAGSVYVVKEPLNAWQQWDLNWFPQEGYSFKRWGCGLALPLNCVE